MSSKPVVLHLETLTPKLEEKGEEGKEETWDGDTAQLGECLPRMCAALGEIQHSTNLMW